jgi:hypothetical protein
MSEIPVRKFGLTFGVVFAALALWLRANTVAMAALGALSVHTHVDTFARPALLAGPARLWRRLGELMHRIVSPVVLGLMYLGLFVPFGLARRWLSGDPLKRGYDARAASYWTPCEPRTRTLDDFRQQF